jgi:D-alanyl-D-alanine dipeptidase
MAAVFGALERWRQTPIPDQEPVRARRVGCRSLPIDSAFVHFTEPLADLRALGIAGENYYWSERNPPYWQRVAGAIPDLLARQSVAQKLVAVNAGLAEAGLELYVFDAWRPRAVQAYFHDVWMPAQLAKFRPDLAGNALTLEVERYWAAPTRGAESPAPHATGGAVDLSIRWIGGDLLWMGSLFDDATAIAHRDHFETEPSAMCFSDEEARANRRLLHWAMDAEGFSGHAEEWWHFSWGDQMWASARGEAAAVYGEAVVGER